jgi:WD40 repeat protein
LEADGFQVFLDRASYASGDDARVWNAGTGEVIAVLERHRKTVWSAAFDPDGGRVVTAQRPLKLGILPACATTSCKARSCETPWRANAVLNRSSPREQLSVRNDDWLLWNIQPDGTVEEPHKASRARHLVPNWA